MPPTLRASTLYYTLALFAIAGVLLVRRTFLQRLPETRRGDASSDERIVVIREGDDDDARGVDPLNTIIASLDAKKPKSIDAIEDDEEEEDDGDENDDSETTAKTKPKKQKTPIPLLPYRHAENLVQAANDGMHYYIDPDTQRNRVKVILWGAHWKKDGFLELSGCPIDRKRRSECPFHPRCQIFHTENEADIDEADVVVIPMTEAKPPAVGRIHARKALRRVVYRREAFWQVAYNHDLLQSKFAFDMSFRLESGVMNPIFLRTPREIFGKMSSLNIQRVGDSIELPPEFAMSLISDCKTISKRETYVRHLSKALGPHRLHQYGSCGSGKYVMPRNNYVQLKQYKFYLSFENSILNGYVSEKLYDRLRFGPIPVYYGAPDVPNITRTPSFINAADFPNPEALARYLIHLAQNPSEYMKYHEWRRDIHTAFTDSFLKAVARNVPGATEMNVTKARLGPKRTFGVNRRAACCRLCNLQYVERVSQGFDWSHIKMPRSEEWINEKYFNYRDANRNKGGVAAIEEGEDDAV